MDGHMWVYDGAFDFAGKQRIGFHNLSKNADWYNTDSTVGSVSCVRRQAGAIGRLPSNPKMRSRTPPGSFASRPLSVCELGSNVPCA
jgi:hypothetical protein